MNNYTNFFCLSLCLFGFSKKVDVNNCYYIRYLCFPFRTGSIQYRIHFTSEHNNECVFLFPLSHAGLFKQWNGRRKVIQSHSSECFSFLYSLFPLFFFFCCFFVYSIFSHLFSPIHSIVIKILDWNTTRWLHRTLVIRFHYIFITICDNSTMEK